ncbi:MAG: RNA methyltransferase [Bacteroidetes bacterium]|nr:RNA methyltransferase [Bacteroidota bacterium]
MLSKALIKQIRSLQIKKFRDSEHLFVVEGPKMLVELINSPKWKVDHIYSTDESLVEEICSSAPFSIISERELEQISGLSTPNKVLATVHYEETHRDKKNNFSGFYILLDKIQDPGNLGTIIRIADWFGVDGLICSNESVDFYNPKVIQASMGSVFRIPIQYVNLTNFLDDNSKTAKLPVYAAMLEGESIYGTNLPKDGFLLMGNESKGVDSLFNNFITNKLHIPAGKSNGPQAESLNVAIATAIICSEWARNK